MMTVTFDEYLAIKKKNFVHKFTSFGNISVIFLKKGPGYSLPFKIDDLFSSGDVIEDVIKITVTKLQLSVNIRFETVIEYIMKMDKVRIYAVTPQNEKK